MLAPLSCGNIGSIVPLLWEMRGMQKCGRSIALPTFAEALDLDCVPSRRC